MRAKETDFSGQTINGIKFIKLIGQGNWADVYLAEDVTSHVKTAVKVTSQKKLGEVPKLRELVQAQINILKQCRNPNVVRLLSQFHQADHQFIVLEYCSGFELGDVLLREGKLDEPTAVNYIKQILNGFKGLHEVRAMHRDFKVENVMLHQGICKIVDLGFGKQLGGGELARTKLGSNLTMAPEIMQGLPYDFRADIWSIGVVFYQMLYGKFPIHARSPLGLLEKARNHDYSLESDEVSEDSKDFIRKCLKFDPQERINWIDVYRHPLIADDSHEVAIGPPQSKINVEENINFYLKGQKELEKEIQPPEVVKQSAIRPIGKHKEEQPKNIQKKQELRKEEDNVYQKKELKRHEEKKIEYPEMSIIKEQSSINSLNSSAQNKRPQLEKRNEKHEQLTEQLLKDQQMMVVEIIKNIKYRYLQQIDSIEFVSHYTLATMRETQALGSDINHLPLLCLLLKDAYLRLQFLNDNLNFRKNIYNFPPTEFQYFLDDAQTPEILRAHLKQARELFQQYRGFLSQQEFKDQRVRRAVRSVNCKQDMPEVMLDEYLYRHAKNISNIKYSGKWPVYCKLLKLSFCLFKYGKYRHTNWSRKRILNTINNFNCERAYVNQCNRAATQNRSAPQYVVRRRPFVGFFRMIGFGI